MQNQTLNNAVIPHSSNSSSSVAPVTARVDTKVHLEDSNSELEQLDTDNSAPLFGSGNDSLFDDSIVDSVDHMDADDSAPRNDQNADDTHVAHSSGMLDSFEDSLDTSSRLPPNRLDTFIPSHRTEGKNHGENSIGRLGPGDFDHMDWKKMDDTHDLMASLHDDSSVPMVSGMMDHEPDHDFLGPLPSLETNPRRSTQDSFITPAAPAVSASSVSAPSVPSPPTSSVSAANSFSQQLQHISATTSLPSTSPSLTSSPASTASSVTHWNASTSAHSPSASKSTPVPHRPFFAQSYSTVPKLALEAIAVCHRCTSKAQVMVSTHCSHKWCNKCLRMYGVDMHHLIKALNIIWRCPTCHPPVYPPGSYTQPPSGPNVNVARPPAQKSNGSGFVIRLKRVSPDQGSPDPDPQTRKKLKSQEVDNKDESDESVCGYRVLSVSGAGDAQNSSQGPPSRTGMIPHASHMIQSGFMAHPPVNRPAPFTPVGKPVQTNSHGASGVPPYAAPHGAPRSNDVVSTSAPRPFPPMQSHTSEARPSSSPAAVITHATVGVVPQSPLAHMKTSGTYLHHMPNSSSSGAFGSSNASFVRSAVKPEHKPSPLYVTAAVTSSGVAGAVKSQALTITSASTNPRFHGSASAPASATVAVHSSMPKLPSLAPPPPLSSPSHPNHPNNPNNSNRLFAQPQPTKTSQGSPIPPPVDPKKLRPIRGLGPIEAGSMQLKLSREEEAEWNAWNDGEFLPPGSGAGMDTTVLQRANRGRGRPPKNRTRSSTNVTSLQATPISQNQKKKREVFRFAGLCLYLEPRPDYDADADKDDDELLKEERELDGFEDSVSFASKAEVTVSSAAKPSSNGVTVTEAKESIVPTKATTAMPEASPDSRASSMSPPSPSSMADPSGFPNGSAPLRPLATPPKVHPRQEDPSKPFLLLVLTWQLRALYIEVPPEMRASIVPKIRHGCVVWLKGRMEETHRVASHDPRLPPLSEHPRQVFGSRDIEVHLPENCQDFPCLHPAHMTSFRVLSPGSKLSRNFRTFIHAEIVRTHSNTPRRGRIRSKSKANAAAENSSPESPNSMQSDSSDGDSSQRRLYPFEGYLRPPNSHAAQMQSYGSSYMVPVHMSTVAQVHPTMSTVSIQAATASVPPPPPSMSMDRVESLDTLDDPPHLDSDVLVGGWSAMEPIGNLATIGRLDAESDGSVVVKAEDMSTHMHPMQAHAMESATQFAAAMPNGEVLSEGGEVPSGEVPIVSAVTAHSPRSHNTDATVVPASAVATPALAVKSAGIVVPSFRLLDEEDIRDVLSQDGSLDTDDEDDSEQTYLALHKQLEQEERKGRIKERQSLTQTWAVCDHGECQKWRLIKEDTTESFFCGNKAKCQPKLCAKLDDWIVHCVGATDAERLAQSGITTVEIFSQRPLLFDVLTNMGFYYDRDTMAIRKY